MDRMNAGNCRVFGMSDDVADYGGTLGKRLEAGPANDRDMAELSPPHSPRHVDAGQVSQRDGARTAEQADVPHQLRQGAGQGGSLSRCAEEVRRHLGGGVFHEVAPHQVFSLTPIMVRRWSEEPGDGSFGGCCPFS